MNTPRWILCARFYLSDPRRGWRWHQLSREIIKEKGKCEVCARKTDLEAHHEKPVHLFPELAFVKSYLHVLCGPCHLTFGHGGAWKNYVENLAAVLSLAAAACRAIIRKRTPDTPDEIPY
jgi:5-methylcytosine-specific restriction endonuclease McrA